MRRAEICCSQSDTSFYHSVFAEHVTKIRDNKVTIEEDVRETNVRLLLEVTDIAKIVRKKIRFGILQTKPLKSRTCKECEKNVTNLQMKTYIRDDNKDTIEDNVRETNVRTFVEVTNIAKIVRKKIPFWILQMKNV